MDTKIKSSAILAKTLARLRTGGKRIVFTNGCFDILHVGHIRYLAKAKSLGDVLVIGLNSDSSVKAIKGNARPINNEKERAEILSSLAFVDYVTIFDEATPEALIEKLKPHILVKGGDWRMRDIIGGDFVKREGGRVVSLPFVKGYSTSSLLKRLSRERE